MNNNKFCINKSVFSLFVITIIFFSLFALSQKIVSTVVTQNNQAAVRKQTTNPVCTYIVGSSLKGTATYVFSALGINYYAPPKDLRSININGLIKNIIVRNGRISSPDTFKKGDVISLLGVNHKQIPCDGEYLGNVVRRDFSDQITSTVFKGYYSNDINGMKNPITAGLIETELKNLCDRQAWNIARYHPDKSLSIRDMGCNFLTVMKTSPIDGRNSCNVYNTAWDAYNAFLAYSNPEQIKWSNIAILGQKAGCMKSTYDSSGCYFGMTEGSLITANKAKVLCP
jgi:hypothetical protein